MEGLLSIVQSHIVKIRRKEPDADWPAFRALVNANIEEICRNFDLRWMVSICDTIADYGDPIEQRNAMLISTVVKMEKIAQTYMHWRLEYPGTLGAPENDRHRKIRLPAGLSSFHLDIGDATNTMFGRIADMQKETPYLLSIFEAVKILLADNDTILGNLNRRHHHVFEHDYSWIRGNEYREYRESGRIPRHRWENLTELS